MGAALGAMLLAAGAATAATSAGATVGCDEVTAARVDGARVLLESVVLPKPAELEAPSQSADDGPLPYFRAARIAIRTGEPDVAVSIPQGWRHRVALSWGRSGSTSEVRFATCAGAGEWSVYAGGFHLARRGDCVPLVVRVGGTSTTVRLGIGRACGRSRR
jgi:hypothetical protein